MRHTLPQQIQPITPALSVAYYNLRVYDTPASFLFLVAHVELVGVEAQHDNGPLADLLNLADSSGLFVFGLVYVSILVDLHHDVVLGTLDADVGADQRVRVGQNLVVDDLITLVTNEVDDGTFLGLVVLNALVVRVRLLETRETVVIRVAIHGETRARRGLAQWMLDVDHLGGLAGRTVSGSRGCWNSEYRTDRFADRAHFLIGNHSRKRVWNAPSRAFVWKHLSRLFATDLTFGRGNTDHSRKLAVVAVFGFRLVTRNRKRRSFTTLANATTTS